MIDIKNAKEDIEKNIGRKMTEKEIQTIDIFGELMNVIWTKNIEKKEIQS